MAIKRHQNLNGFEYAYNHDLKIWYAERGETFLTARTETEIKSKIKGSQS